MNQFRKILVVCPANMVTGGPEALHQLVHHMRAMGLPAYMVYTPFGQSADTPVPYRKYQVEQARYEDAPDICIIFPEIYPMEALKVRHAKAALWWLSLDNFLERKNVSRIRDSYHYTRSVLRLKKPLFGVRSLRNLAHYTNTKYASDYLVKYGIEPKMLCDSIDEAYLHLDQKIHPQNRKNIILFNPKKGKKITQSLIETFPEFEFLPIAGYSFTELVTIFSSSKLYIDFGHFPGPERLPREAAILGCCILSGKLGCSGNPYDFPIYNTYKLDIKDKNFKSNFKIMTESIFSDFVTHHIKFENFRNYLRTTPDTFKKQISDYFLDSI